MRLSVVAVLLVVAAGLRTANALKATCVLQPSPGSQVAGNIVLTQQSRNDRVQLEGFVRGLPPGPHGFHIHEFGDLTDGCVSAGEHFNPFNMNHGGPVSQVRHIGDFGNMAADATGQARFSIMDPGTQLFGAQTAIGRAIVIHEKVDDLGQGGNLESVKSGNAGERLACCVIGVAPDFVRL